MQTDTIADSAPQPAATAPLLSLSRNDGFFEFDRQACKTLGTALHKTYTAAEPFPHIMLDNFLDADVLRRTVEEFPKRVPGRFSDSHSQLKTGYTLGMIRSAYIQDFLSALNSAAFLIFLQNMTGIRGLVSDSHFTGGGLHETMRGGHLSIHADFNIHPHNRLQRRLNLILFLNEDWNPAWGGALELWDRGMTARQTQIDPLMARAVIFNTDSNSYHGHPDPLDCPPEIMRRSIALYYYTLPQSPAMIPHTTLFQVRPGTNDVQPSRLANLVGRLKRRMKGMRNIA